MEPAQVNPCIMHTLKRLKRHFAKMPRNAKYDMDILNEQPVSTTIVHRRNTHAAQQREVLEQLQH